jgi:N-acetylneuraminic acid mutarotase
MTHHLTHALNCLGLALAVGFALASRARAANGAWTECQPMPTPRFSHTASVVDGRIYVIGGGGLAKRGPYLSIVEVYDPKTGSWSRKADMPTARHGHAASVVNGRIYVVGGELAAQASLNVVEEYDPAADAWKRKAPMPTRRTFHCAGTVNGMIYVLGGITAPYDGVAWNPAGVDAYDPVRDTWTTKGKMALPRAGAAACVIDSKIYVMGGVSGFFPDNPALATVEVYDPAAGAWTAKAQLPMARVFLSASAIGGKLYAVGGAINGGATFTAVDEYDPPTNRWRIRPPIGSPTGLLATAAVGLNLYEVGGSEDWGNWSGTSTLRILSLIE